MNPAPVLVLWVAVASAGPGHEGERAEDPAEKRAREVLLRAAEAAGGVEALRKVADLSWEFRRTQGTEGGERAVEGSVSLRFPDGVRSEVRTEAGTIVIAVRGEEGFLDAPQGGTDRLPAFLVRDQRGLLYRHEAFLLPRALDGPARAVHRGEDKVGGRTVDLVEVSEGEQRVTLYVDREGRVVRKAFRGLSGTNRPIDVEEVSGEFRAAGGITLPMRIERFEGGTRRSVTEIRNVRINPGLQDGLFRKG